MKEFIISEAQTERAVLVGLVTPEQNEQKVKEYLDELAFLADTAGVESVKRFTQKMDYPNSVTFVGTGKLQEIKAYVEENEIIRPDDFLVKSMPNKSSEKIFIIQSIDRRMDLEDIASARGMEMDELLTAIENIVDSGTRLDLNYYIDQNIDSDVVNEIYGYFRDEAETDSLEDALNELQGDYEELEIRLVRIKFISEVAN